MNDDSGSNSREMITIAMIFIRDKLDKYRKINKTHCTKIEAFH